MTREATGRWQMHRLARVASSALLTCLLAIGCTGSDGESGEAIDEPLLVMAAASLGSAMPALIDRFESTRGTPVDLATGATGSLAAQIENGAPADLFFAADEATVERLVRSGAIRGASVRTYATGKLALVWRDGIEPPEGLQALADRRYEVVAIANPEVAPYGAAAREALGRLELWNDISRRTVQGENVAQSYQLVRTGNADAAFVARSVVDTVHSEFLIIDPQLHTPIRQAAGILERSGHPDAEAFLAFVRSDEGQALLERHGFARAPD